MYTVVKTMIHTIEPWLHKAKPRFVKRFWRSPQVASGR
jgi:hypothetical protein